MKVAVLGAGALGSVIAGHLTRAGEDVTLIARGERAEYLKKQGITITGLGDFNTPCNVTTNPKEVSEADYLIVAVKTYQMESALMDVGHLEVSSVLSVQNGVLKNEQLAKVFGEDKTLGATAHFSGEVMPEGPVRFTFNESFHIGELPEGTSKRVQNLVTALDGAGIHAEAEPQIQTVEWSKFVGWVGLMALSVLIRLETYKLLSNDDSVIIGARIIRETASLAEKLGVSVVDIPPIPGKTIATVSEQQAVETLRGVGAVIESRAPNHRMSSLQDLERGRRLEVEETLGYVVTKAAEEDVPVPTVETCYHLISGMNQFLH